MANLNVLQTSLGVTFTNVSLLEQALVHGSYINENPRFSSGSNERLEFLGDAVLGLVIAEKLFQDFPDFDEGKMTRLRASLVRGETLARTAGAVHLGDYLYLGKGEEASGGRNKIANLAAALEAVIAAVFLDQGLLVTRNFILNLLAQELREAVNQGKRIDYKSELQEFVQAKEQKAPTYHVKEVVGPERDREFVVEVKVGRVVLGEGSGKSKKLAETEAARAALEKIRSDFTR